MMERKRRNKFLGHEVRQSAATVTPPQESEGERALDFLNECAACWASLSQARRKLQRSLMYSYGDQWGDYVKDPDTGRWMTEGDLIKRNGKVPLKNNMIAPILNNIDGQFRQNLTRPVCAVRDQSESKIGEMMSVAIEYVHDLNEAEEIDAECLRMLLNGGMTAQRIEYGINPAKNKRDVWLYSVNPSRLFFNTNVEDARLWDLHCIGEVYDITLDEVVSHFARTRAQKERIEALYGPRQQASLYGASYGMQGDESRDLTFYTASRPELCRVILGWKLESRDAYRWNDTERGTWGYLPCTPQSRNRLDGENAARVQALHERGAGDDDLLPVEYEFAVERYWYYRYMTPQGDILQEGRSPYWHGEHNYVLHLYPLVQGKMNNFVEQFIDQQRAINRTATLIDFIRGTSSKGVLVVDDDAFEDMTREEVVDEYVRYNGVLFVKLKPGQSVDSIVRQYNSGASVAGDFELLNLQLRLINEISGVNSAIQGQAPRAGTPASLYAQQVQNSSLNLRGLFDSYRNFRRRRDFKLMKTIQQYYTEERHIELAGKDYSEEAKYYNPQKVQNAEIDLTIADGYNTPAFQMVANDFLMELFRSRAVDVKTLLENCSYPFAPKILEAVKRNEQELMQGRAMEGIPPELLKEVKAAAQGEKKDETLKGENEKRPLETGQDNLLTSVQGRDEELPAALNTPEKGGAERAG